jgi:hypothetical protein
MELVNSVIFYMWNCPVLEIISCLRRPKTGYESLYLMTDANVVSVSFCLEIPE